MNAKRGYVPEDERNFSPDAIEKLRTASHHVYWLLGEGYDLKQATVFVGNHFLLSERQRLAVMRSVASSDQICERRSKLTNLSDLKEKTMICIMLGKYKRALSENVPGCKRRERT